MEIVIVSAFHLFPCAAAEVGAVVAGGIAVCSLSEIKVIAIFPFRVFQGFLKPFMLVRAVIDYQVHKYVHISLFCFCQKCVKIFHRAERFINFVIVGNIIPLVYKRRLVDGGEPYYVNAQIF